MVRIRKGVLSLTQVCAGLLGALAAQLISARDAATALRLEQRHARTGVPVTDPAVGSLSIAALGIQITVNIRFHI